MNFIKVWFGDSSKMQRKIPKVEKLKVVVTEFVEYGNYNFSPKLVKLLERNPNFEVYHFREPFDKKFLSLQGRHFFDLFDTGNKILQKLNADVVIWGYQEDANIRLNFHKVNAYSDWDNVSLSLLDSFYVPCEYFEHITSMPEIIYNLIIGALLCSISEQRRDLQPLKQRLLKDTITKINDKGSIGGKDFKFSYYTFNILGLIFLNYTKKEFSNKHFDSVNELFKNAFLYKNEIMQNIHLGCLYKNMGQLYETAINNDLVSGQHWFMYKEAISNYRLAQKYIDHFNYPYDFALLSFKLAQLYFKYWKFANNMQDLRSAVAYLREAEKTYTQITFPELWSKIEGYLGYYLSLLGLFSKNNDISRLAIKSYQNKQTIYDKNVYPVMWAKIQENIANVYYNMGKIAKDKTSYNEAIEYYESALKVYQSKRMHHEIAIVHNSLEKVIKAFKGK